MSDLQIGFTRKSDKDMTSEYKFKLKGEDRTEHGLAYFTQCDNKVARWRMVLGRNWWERLLMTAVEQVIATDY